MQILLLFYMMNHFKKTVVFQSGDSNNLDDMEVFFNDTYSNIVNEKHFINNLRTEINCIKSAKNYLIQHERNCKMQC